MLKKQTWRALFSSLKKTVINLEIDSPSPFCTSRKESHILAEYPAFLSTPLSGHRIQQTVFSVRFTLFVCLPCYSQNGFSLPLLLVASAAEVIRSLVVLWASHRLLDWHEVSLNPSLLPDVAVQYPTVLAYVSSTEYGIKAVLRKTTPRQCLA